MSCAPPLAPILSDEEEADVFYMEGRSQDAYGTEQYAGRELQEGFISHILRAQAKISHPPANSHPPDTKCQLPPPQKRRRDTSQQPEDGAARVALPP